MKVVLPYENYASKTPPALSKHGPAYTLLLEWNGGESDLYKGMKISVDLTLAVRINSKSTSRGLEFDSPSGRVLKSVLDSLPYFLAVGSYRDPLSEEHPDYFKKEEEQYPGLRPINFYCAVHNRLLSICCLFKNLAQTAVKANALGY